MINYLTVMRNTEEYFKNRSTKDQQKLQQSQSILAKIREIKESALSPHPYKARPSQDPPENWNQYLPKSNNRHSYHQTSQLSDDGRSENYRYSLEKRLERLFGEERQMLKARNIQNLTHLNSQLEKSCNNHPPQSRGSAILKPYTYSSNDMQRKIRQLQQRYQRETKRQPQRHKQAPTQCHQDNSNKQNQIYQPIKHQICSQQLKSYNQKILTESVQKCILKEKALEEEVYLLKKQVQELHQSKEELEKKIHHREERKKNKIRTKQLLKSILHKLDCINVEIEKNKIKQLYNRQNEVKQSQSNDLTKQFQQLQAQYQKFSAENRKVMEKQSTLEKRLNSLSSKKNQQ